MGGLFGGGGAMSNTPPMAGALRVQTSVYGSVIPLVYGRQRVAANLVWYGDFKGIPQTTNQSAGGKGGGVSQQSTTYTYQTAVAMGLCEGPVRGLGSVWVGKQQYIDGSSSAAGQLNLALFGGGEGQSAWPYLTGRHTSQAVPYSGLAYVASDLYELGDNASLANHNFEVEGLLQVGGGIGDANPGDILPDFLTHPRYGAQFPSARLAGLDDFRAWCRANGLLMSPAYTEQRPAREIVAELVEMSGAALVDSGGLLRVVPRGDTPVTGGGITWTPSLTPVAHLTDDDFLGDASGDPVTVTRRADADVHNEVVVEFANRANQYNLQTATATDQASIEAIGRRPRSVIKLHGVADPVTAQKIAQLYLQRDLYVRNTYEFRLGWNWVQLEPMDIVTLTDPGLGLDQTPVRIVRITESGEDGGGDLSVTAEEMPQGVASVTAGGVLDAGGTGGGLGSDPGPCEAPLIYEPPTALSEGRAEVWLCVAGLSPAWGGASVWASYDGDSYQRLGRVIGPARYGTLTAPLASTSDTSGTLAVHLLTGQMLSASQVEVDSDVTLCLVGDELVSYRDATLTGAGAYSLTYLKRGRSGSAVTAHTAGQRFARLDAGVFKYSRPDAAAGKTVYVKLTSFNVFGQAEQSPADVPAYQITLKAAPNA